MIHKVAGCTTGSLCPGCPSTERSSKPLLKAEFFLSLGETLPRLIGRFSAPRHNVPLAHNIRSLGKRSMEKVARALGPILSLYLLLASSA